MYGSPRKNRPLVNNPTSPDKNKAYSKKTNEIKDKISKKKKNQNIRRIKLKALFDEDQYFQDMRKKEIPKFLQDEYMHYTKTQTEELLHAKADLNCTIQALISFISMFCAVANYEISRYDRENSAQAMFAQYFCFGLTIFLIFTICYDFYIKTEIHGINKNIKGSIIRKRFSSYSTLIVEILLFILHPNPVFIGKTFPTYLARFHIYAEYKWNTLMSVFCFLRVWYWIKLYLVQSEFYCPRSARLGRLYGADLGTFYALKANMVSTPFYSFLVLYGSSWLFGFMTARFFEISVENITNTDFSTVWNAMWITLITMTTVGYGDFYPDSLGGRIICIFSCLVAAFLISLSISTFNQLLLFENGEEDICNLIERIDMHKSKEEKAKRLVFEYMNSMRLLKKKTKEQGRIPTDFELEEIKLKVFMQLESLKSKKEEINYTYPPQSQQEVYLEGFVRVENTMDSLTEKMIALNAKVNDYADKYHKLCNIEDTIERGTIKSRSISHSELILEE